jgi:ABC-type amino acid transport substrate-binding protein
MFTCHIPLLLLAAINLSQGDLVRTKRNENTIVVTTIEEVPYLQVKDTGSGNDRFTGFIPDLMKKIGNLKNIKYEFRLVEDKKYGMRVNGQWNGMIGELIKGNAQLAAAPLTISDNRKQAISFTEPFMDLGTTMLSKKPASGESPINSFEDLAQQTEISYGVVKDGYTMAYFKNSQDPDSQKIWRYLDSHSETSMLKNNAEGVKKVRESGGKYIFIMENSTASYWMNQEPCDLLVVGKPISNRNYGFATAKNDNQLNEKVSDAIRTLKENGEIEKLERHWWQKDAKCDNGATSLAVGLATLTLGALSVVLLHY